MCVFLAVLVSVSILPIIFPLKKMAYLILPNTAVLNYATLIINKQEEKIPSE